jgi:hypothetical protein
MSKLSIKDKNNLDYTMLQEIIYCGIGDGESVLHFGAYAYGNDFLKILEDLELDISYTAVDTKEEINTIFSDFKPSERNNPWVSVNESMQEFIDNIDYEKYHWTIITGVFDKPIYNDKQYVFIDMVIKSCLNFSDNLVFTLDVKNTEEFEYNTGFLVLHLLSKYNKLTVKKLSEDKFIFCINK